MSEGIRISIAGPFTLKMTFSLTKDGMPEVGNLLAKESHEYMRSFETLVEAMAFMNTMFKDVK